MIRLLQKNCPSGNFFFYVPFVFIKDQTKHTKHSHTQTTEADCQKNREIYIFPFSLDEIKWMNFFLEMCLGSQQVKRDIFCLFFYVTLLESISLQVSNCGGYNYWYFSQPSRYLRQFN